MRAAHAASPSLARSPCTPSRGGTSGPRYPGRSCSRVPSRPAEGRRCTPRRSTEQHGEARNRTERHVTARHGTARLGSRAMRGNDGQTRVTEDRAVSSRIHGPAAPHRLNSRTGRPRGRRASQLMREASDRDDKVSLALSFILRLSPSLSLPRCSPERCPNLFFSHSNVSFFLPILFPREFPRIAVVAVDGNSWVGWLRLLDELIAAEATRRSTIRG